MLHINSKIYDYLASYKNIWNEQKIITINDFLEEAEAEILLGKLLKVNDSQWSYSIHPYLPNNYVFDNHSGNFNTIKEGIISATNAYNRGEFSYNFRRYEGDINDIKSLLTSSQFTNLIHQITNLIISTLISTFASLYHHGSWLSRHNDSGRGKIAFVYNLTKDWDENNGGNFYLLQPDWYTVKHKVVPIFNSLTIFYVEDGNAPHYVEKVKDDVTQKRICISGWLI